MMCKCANTVDCPFSHYLIFSVIIVIAANTMVTIQKRTVILIHGIRFVEP